MTREIKFRAWDKETHKMFYSIQNLYDGMGDESWENGDIYNTGFSTRSFGSILDSDTPVMQFTGLLDKHGKEIYEGDVLSLTGIWIDEPTEVSFKNGAFGLNGNSFDYGFDELNWENLEIIGNIYSNPELLNNDNK